MNQMLKQEIKNAKENYSTFSITQLEDLLRNLESQFNFFKSSQIPQNDVMYQFTIARIEIIKSILNK